MNRDHHNQSSQNQSMVSRQPAPRIAFAHDRDLPNAVARDAVGGQPLIGSGAAGSKPNGSRASKGTCAKKRNFKAFGNGPSLLQNEDSELVRYDHSNMADQRSSKQKMPSNQNAALSQINNTDFYQRMEVPMKQRKLNKADPSLAGARSLGKFQNQPARLPFQDTKSRINIAANPFSEIGISNQKQHKSHQKFPALSKFEKENGYLGGNASREQHLQGRKSVERHQMQSSVNNQDQSPSQSQFKLAKGHHESLEFGANREKQLPSPRVFKLSRISEVSHSHAVINDNGQSNEAQIQMEDAEPVPVELNLFKYKDSKRSISAISDRRQSGFGPLFDPQPGQDDSIFRTKAQQPPNDCAERNQLLIVQRKNLTPEKAPYLLQGASPSCKLSVQRDFGGERDFELEEGLADSSLDLGANDFEAIDQDVEEIKQEDSNGLKISGFKLPFQSDLTPITKKCTPIQNHSSSNTGMLPSNRESLLSQINLINLELNHQNDVSPNQNSSVQVLNQQEISQNDALLGEAFARSHNSRNESNLEFDLSNQDQWHPQLPGVHESMQLPIEEQSESANVLNQGFLLDSQQSLSLSSINMSQDPQNPDGQDPNQLRRLQTTASTVIQTSMRNLSLNASNQVDLRNAGSLGVQPDQRGGSAPSATASREIFSISELMNE